jgi:glycosyltransferase involved in cell wall biosynthesis
VRIVYVTSRFPYGPGEAFLGAEIAAHLRAGWGVTVFPAIRRGRLEHGDAAGLADAVHYPSRFTVAADLVRVLGGSGKARAAARSALLAAQAPRTRTKNAAVLSRLGTLVRLLHRSRAEHLHVHWGGASSTRAMAAAEAAGIPWSLTLHRWDIFADNLLAAKIGAASFTRVISEGSVADVRSIVPDAQPVVVHMGVELPASPAALDIDRPCRLVCVASLLPVKDHETLLRAFAAATDDDRASLELVGAGPLERELRALVSELGLEDRVWFVGAVEHESLLARMRSGEWDAVVLSSTDDGSEREGIPVSLMEAMAAGLPAVATDSGGTRELVRKSSGILVPPGDRAALAEALHRVIDDPRLRARLGAGARSRVAEAFDVDKVAAELRALMGARS